MDATRYTPEFDLDVAHKFSSVHRKDVEGSEICGCFYCLSVFPPKVIEEWIDEDKEGVAQTAMCPRCGIDSVIGSKSGFPITNDFLTAMRRRWFNE